MLMSLGYNPTQENILRGHFRIPEMASNLGEHEGMYPLVL